VRILGLLLFVLGMVGSAYCVWGSFARRRPVDIAFALGAPLALTLAVVGAVLVWVPGFFSP